MPHPGLPGVFADHAFLKNLSQRHLMLLGSEARPVSFAEGEYLAKEGEPAKAFYLIKSGHVSLGTETDNHTLLGIQELGAGEPLGWSWLVPPHHWRFTAQARDQVEAIAINAAWLRDQCEADHELGYHILKQLAISLAERLAATRLKMSKATVAV
jgi:CRP-like cAMP-binding protein